MGGEDGFHREAAKGAKKHEEKWGEANLKCVCFCSILFDRSGRGFCDKYLEPRELCAEMGWWGREGQTGICHFESWRVLAG